MADSHDNLNAIKLAVRIFKDAGCSLVIHAGDIIAPFAAKELEHLGCPVKAVFGNCDGEKAGLEKTFSAFGEIQDAPLVFNRQKLCFLVMHVPSDLNTHLASGKYNVVICAHTHRPKIRKEKNSLLINPGETGGWLTGKNTIVLLDAKTLSTEIISL